MPREVPVDLQNNSSKEYVYRSKHAKLFKNLAKKNVTHFNKRECEGTQTTKSYIFSVSEKFKTRYAIQHWRCYCEKSRNQTAASICQFSTTSFTRGSILLKTSGIFSSIGFLRFSTPKIIKRLSKY